MVDGSEPNIVIFEPNERLSLANIQPEEYRKHFAGYEQLLVLDEGDLVLGATRSTDRDELLEAVDQRFPLNKLGSVTFWDGPLAIERNVRAGAFRQNSRSRGHSDDRSN